MNEEMDALYGNEMCKLMALPKGKKPIGYRWVYIAFRLLVFIGMKDLGELRYFLGIEMIRNEGGIWLSQKKYGLNMLMKYGMADCKPISTPVEVED
ncbi:hypothetical protein L7F22_064093 [Adiantum nelumboides]|nr:hypothetical protein [Adiantum nelumboides]